MLISVAKKTRAGLIPDVSTSPGQNFMHDNEFLTLEYEEKAISSAYGGPVSKPTAMNLLRQDGVPLQPSRARLHTLASHGLALRNRARG